MNKTIETERLILRPLEKEDAQDIFEWASDPVVNKYMPYTLYQNVHQAEDWIASIKDKENVNEFAFYLKDMQKVIGAGSVNIVSEEKVCELGYNLNQAFWRKGYATEAAKAMIQWAYQNLHVRDFVAKHANLNTVSGNVLKKCGFVFDYFGQYSCYDGSETFDASYYYMHLE